MTDGVSHRLRSAGWRQGDIVAYQHSSDYILLSVDRRPNLDLENVKLIVLTQDCDLLQPEVKEPFVELIGTSISSQADPNCLYLRNPRKLFLPYGPEWLNMSIHDRFRVPKVNLAAMKPDRDRCITEVDRRVLKKWVAARYTRPAFPDEFNKRLDANKKLQDKVTKHVRARLITGILIMGAEEELSPEVPYTIKVLLPVPPLSFDHPELSQLEQDIEKALTCPGIQVLDVIAQSEDEITMSMMKIYNRLDFDYRSLPESESTAITPERIDLE